MSLRISRSENLPVLPTVVIQILRLFEDPLVSPRSLERIIEQDAALSAKILRVAGSSMYGARSATSVNRALSVLGINTLRSISISLAYQQILTVKKVGAQFDRIAFWRHCLAVGIGARAIARLTNPSVMEELYVAGLMHDIGVLALDRFVPAGLTTAIKKANMHGLSLDEAEREVLGYSHSEAGCLLAENWKLSPLIVAAIRHHHTPEQSGIHKETTNIIAAANCLAYKANYPAMPGIVGGREGEPLLTQLGLSEEQIEQVLTSISVEVDQADSVYGGQRAAA